MAKNNEIETEKTKKQTTNKSTAKKNDVSIKNNKNKDASTKKKTVASKTNNATKTNNKSQSKKSTVSNKKTTTTTTKINNTKKDNVVKNKAVVENNKTSEKLKMELSKKVEDAKKSTPKKEENNEISIIDRIKNFIAKIAAMQEEAKKEELNNKDNKEKDTKGHKQAKTKQVESPKVDYMLEYYDLPYRYNETTVKILAQTPKKIFVYWDISDNDREKYIKTFGDDFFYKTYPVLLLYDKDRNKVSEILIDDFANSWYIDIEDPKTRYTIQLGRKFKEKPSFVNFSIVEKNAVILRNDYLPFANSNILEVPNDHILLERIPDFITFRNVKTNQETHRDLRSFKDVFGANYDVKQFYVENYSEEITENGMFDMKNPSSNVSSSSFK